jgi:hypothetical protein
MLTGLLLERLIWPVLPNGSPDLVHVPGQQGDDPVVWETWQTVAPPAAPHFAAPPDVALGPRVLIAIVDATGRLPDLDHPFGTDPLLDQSGRYAR